VSQFYGNRFYQPESIPSHLQLGAASTELLQNSVTMTAELLQDGGEIDVTVKITNTAAGHHVPTDHPGRHLILTVTVVDGNGHSLAQLRGPQVPTWGGAQAEVPGTAYAKVLRDSATGQYPVVSYWKQTSIVTDNRIPAGESDTSTYTFAAPPGGETASVSVELRFRRVFQNMLDAKDWQTPDVIMEEVSKELIVEPWWRYYLPLAITR